MYLGIGLGPLLPDALTPGPSPKGRGERNALTPGPSPASGRGESFALAIVRVNVLQYRNVLHYRKLML